MAGSASDYLEGKILDELFLSTAFSAPATYYVALLTDSNSAAQRDAGTVTEVSGGSYARVAVANGAAEWTRSAGQVTNDNPVDFGTASANWGTVRAWALYDASTGGNLINWGDLSTAKTVTSGDSFELPANTGIVITLD